MTQPQDVLLRCQKLVVGHDGKPLLPPIDLELKRGTFLVVVGRNGSGKSTFFRTLLGLLPPVGGQVIRARPDLRLAYGAQTIAVDRALPLRSRDVVGWGRLSGWNFLGRGGGRVGAHGRDVVDRSLAESGATALAERPFRDLSEGQKQRVLVARLLAAEADVALLDEPTSSMDVVAERETIAHLCRVTRERQMLTIFVSHMLGVAAEHADLVAFFDREDGAVVIGEPRVVLAHDLFRKHFGHVAEIVHGDDHVG